MVLIRWKIITKHSLSVLFNHSYLILLILATDRKRFCRHSRCRIKFYSDSNRLLGNRDSRRGAIFSPSLLDVSVFHFFCLGYGSNSNTGIFSTPLNGHASMACGSILICTLYLVVKMVGTILVVLEPSASCTARWVTPMRSVRLII